MGKQSLVALVVAAAVAILFALSKGQIPRTFERHLLEGINSGPRFRRSLADDSLQNRTRCVSLPFSKSEGVLGYKFRGETMTECQSRIKGLLKMERNKPDGRKICWTGRLDPMAEGLVVFLLSPDSGSQKEGQSLSKEYWFRMLLGVQTDTYDSFGIIESSNHSQAWREHLERLHGLLRKLGGRRIQKYPPFSSIAGRNASGYSQALWKWSTQGRLDEIEDWPTKNVTVYSVESIQEDVLDGEGVLRMLRDDFERLAGNSSSVFRLDQIMKSWKDAISKKGKVVFPVVTCRANVSSGTYVRSLCHEIGMQLGCGGIAIDILRSSLGPFNLRDLD